MMRVFEHRAYLGLGSNIGDREHHLAQALNDLHNHLDIHIQRLSAIFETDPVGHLQQGAFLNMAIQVHTRLDPEQLLEITLAIEAQGGRKREMYWGPRTIDIDILLYDDISLTTGRLQIPHPRMQERAFVLIPLQEIAGSQQVPGIGATVHHLAGLLNGKGVHSWNNRFHLVGGAFELSAN